MAGACAVPLGHTVDRNKVFVGIAASGGSYSAALQGDEAASLAAGKTLSVDTGVVSMHVDLPLVWSRFASARLRFVGGIRWLQGNLGAVSLSELRALAPGLADLIVDTAEDFGSLPGTQSIVERGEEAFSGNLADRFQLHDVGLDIGAMILASGPRFALDLEDYVEVAEFGVGAFFHASDMKITLTDKDSRSSQHYLGFGMGLTLRLAPVTFFLRSLGDARIQPLVVRADLFGLLTRGDLRAIVLTAAVETSISWRF